MTGIVFINGRDSGIRESNYAWASVYWSERARLRPELKIKVKWQ